MTAVLSTNGTAVHVEDAPPTRLLVATTRGAAVLERDELGAPWRKAGRVLEGHHLSSLMVTPDGAIWAGVHNGGLFRSTDDGVTWEQRDSGITVPHVYSLGCRETDTGVTLYVGTEPVGIFRSTDDGASWQELPAIKSVPDHEKWSFPPPPHWPHTKSFLFDPRDPGTFYVAIEQGALLKTQDGGESWTEIDSFSRPDDPWYKDVHRILYRPSDPDELIMLTGIGLYVSPDAGETWDRRTDGDFRIGYPDQIILSPLDENVMFMCGANGNPTVWRRTHQANGWILRTRDGGKSWEEANQGLPVMAQANIEAFTASYFPGGYELYAGNTDGEVYASSDDGDSWQMVADDLEPVSKGGHFRTLQQVAGQQVAAQQVAASA